MAARKVARKKHILNDAYVEALRDFIWEQADDEKQPGPMTIWDRTVPGLRVRVGKLRTTFEYFAQQRVHTKRKHIYRRLGVYPFIKVSEARKLALVEAGKAATGRIAPGKRKALKLGDALDNYLAYLRNKAARKDKPPRHALNVEKLRRLHFGEFERWPMADLSDNPEIVRDWHAEVTRDHGPVTANRAAEVLRACYRFARKTDRHLPPDLPTSGIVFNAERIAKIALRPADFPKWAKAWREIESPVRRAFHLCNLLLGCRPGELARLRWEDVNPRERTLTIVGSKAGHDIKLPLSIEIVKALKLARGADKEWVFPGAAQIGHRDALPARGMQLRHTYRNMLAEAQVSELFSHLLMGHRMPSMNSAYVVEMILAAGPGLRKAQAKIGRRIVGLLGMNFKIR